MLRAQLCCNSVFGWLRAVAIHEAYRLLTIRAARRRRALSARPRATHAPSPSSLARSMTPSKRWKRCGPCIAAAAPTRRPDTSHRRVHLQGDPGPHSGTHDDQRRQVPAQRPGARAPLAAISRKSRPANDREHPWLRQRTCGPGAAPIRRHAGARHIGPGRRALPRHERAGR